MIHTVTRQKYTYAEYRELMDRLVGEGKTTGPLQNEAMAHYTFLNHKRMARLDKKGKLTPELQASVERVDRSYTFLILTEAWCGDAAQNIPLFQLIADANPNFKLELVLRDENLDLMDAHLTNGGRSIPKVLVVDDATQEVLGSWGPRPAEVQAMVMEYKAIPEEERPPYSEFVVTVQNWYNRDKTISAQRELLQLLEQTIHQRGQDIQE